MIKCNLCNGYMHSFLTLKEYEFMYCNTCFSIRKCIYIHANTMNSFHSDTDSSRSCHLEIKCNFQQSLKNCVFYMYYNNRTLDITLHGMDNYDVVYYNYSNDENYSKEMVVNKWYMNAPQQKFEVIVIDGVFDHLENFDEMFEYLDNVSYDDSKIYINVTHANIINKTRDIFFSNCQNFWTTNTMKQLCTKHGYTTVNANIYVDNDYCTYEICKSNVLEENNIFTLMIDELDRELYSSETYDTFQFRYLMFINTFMNFILYCKMINTHVIGYGEDTQFKYFESVYGNYIKYFEYLITEDNSYDVLEQIRHNNNNCGNAVVIMFGGGECNVDFEEHYSRVKFIKLFDIEKLTTTLL